MILQYKSEQTLFLSAKEATTLKSFDFCMLPINYSAAFSLKDFKLFIVTKYERYRQMETQNGTSSANPKDTGWVLGHLESS